MKRLLSFVFMIFMMKLPVIASANTVITYGYDDAGNRVTRTTTTETETAESADSSDTDKEGGSYENS